MARLYVTAECIANPAGRQMAEAAVRGAAGESVQVRLLPVAQAQVEDVLGADFYIIATPEDLASLAGAMKEFFDRTYYAVPERRNGRPYAMLVCAGSDGENAVRQIRRIATGRRLRLVADPVIVRTHAQTPEAILAPKVIGAVELGFARILAPPWRRAWPRASSDACGRQHVG